MYTPKHFAMTDEAEIWAFMQQNSFGILFSQVNEQPQATHIPFLFDQARDNHGSLIGHMAKANPHWRYTETDVLVVFSGPHTYISPTWYEAENTVPTWNYLAVHVYGQFRVIDDKDRSREILHETVHVYEAMMPKPWQVDMSPKNFDKLMNGIVAFEIEITRIQGKKKLNQNHSTDRREKVISALGQIDRDDAQAIAREMSASVP